MRRITGTSRTGTMIFGALIAASLSGAAHAQGGGEEKARSIEGGGIHASGWQGQVDAGAARHGQSINDDKLTQEGNALHITTGPAADFWNPKETAQGDYTVSADFREPKYMTLNDHPHPYGVFIGGNNMGTDQQTLLYCAAYGDGTFIVRGFGPAAFHLGGLMPVKNAAIHKADKPGDPVEQTIALSVKGDTVSCAINGAVVASYPKSDLVTTGKLKSTDGTYGVRSAHNTEVVVTNLKLSKP